MYMSLLPGPAFNALYWELVDKGEMEFEVFRKK
jgi:hypothetical protein